MTAAALVPQKALDATRDAQEQIEAQSRHPWGGRSAMERKILYPGRAHEVRMKISFPKVQRISEKIRSESSSFFEIFHHKLEVSGIKPPLLTRKDESESSLIPLLMPTQDDFTVLTVSDCQNAGFMQKLVDHESFSSSAGSLQSSKRCVEDDEAYVPTNFIKAEVYAMIAAWEACAQKRNEEIQSLSAATSLTHCPDFSVFEPIRSVPDPTPPKRFYRTFWRSITRKLMSHHLESVKASAISETTEKAL